MSDVQAYVGSGLIMLATAMGLGLWVRTWWRVSEHRDKASTMPEPERSIANRAADDVRWWDR